MTVIRAPFSAPPNRLGIGSHQLVFVEKVCTDPGLNAGERAYLQGLGYLFEEEAEKPARKAPAKAKAKAAPAPEPVVEPEPEAAPADEAPAETPAE